MRRADFRVVPCAAFAAGIGLLSGGTLGDPGAPVLPIWQAPALAGLGDSAPDFAPLRAHPSVDPAAWINAAGDELALPDFAAIMAEDEARDGQPGLPHRVGIVRPLSNGPISTSTHGMWEVQADGSRIWRAMLRSVGARSLGVNFAKLELPPGASLTIAPMNPRVDGRRFYDHGPGQRGFLYAPEIDGDTACIEVHVPAGVDGQAVLAISALVHNYRGVPRVGQRELSCNVDVNCRTLARPWMQNCVGRMLYQVGGSSFVCTGALIDENAPGYFPAFFLTADHCLSTQAVADTLNVYWFYQTPSCNGAVPSLGSLPVTSGATLLTGSPIGSGYDHTLLRLSDDARSAQTFSPLGTTTSTPAIGVHHPGGTFKRYAAYNFVSSGPSCGTLPLSQFYWLRWFDGRTEGGSSGSPLFNDQGQIIGQLYGTCFFTGADLNSCTPVTDVNNIYGRVDGSIGSMAPFIVAPGDAAFAPNFTQATAKPLSPGTTTNLVLTSFQDWFFVDIASTFTGTFSASFSWVSTADQRLQLYSPAGALLQSATPNSAGTATLTRALTPGRYFVRVYRDRGHGGTYSLTIPSDCGPSLVPCIDGSLDASYGPPLAVQTTATGFGDNTLGLTGFADGSELNGAYARVIGSNLFLFLPGNLESNFNDLEIFIDSVPGGQNRLIGVEPPFAVSLAQMASTTPTDGLRFDAGFEADRYFQLQGASDGIEYRMYVDFVEIPTVGAGPIAYLGSTTAAGNGSLSGGQDTLGVRAAINNSNIAGVTAGFGPSSGAGVNTGIEIMIPLSVLGNPTCGIKVCAFINGAFNDFVSNQSMAPMPPGTTNLGDPRSVNFAAIAGNQFIEIPIAPAVAITSNPTSIVRCPTASGSFTVAATGATGTAWSVESPAESGVYVPLAGSVFTEPSSGLSFTHAGADTSTLSVSGVVLGTHPRVIRFRSGLLSGCGVVNAVPATLTVCVADFDCNASLTIGDLFTYLNAWFLGDPRCDVNGVNGLTIEDLFAYLNIWFAGCA